MAEDAQGNSQCTGTEVVVMSIKEMTCDEQQLKLMVRDVFNVINWIYKGNMGEKPFKNNHEPHPAAVRLQERFLEATGRISELEERLEDSMAENKSLVEKLEVADRVQDHLECEITVLKGELESQKWQRFDAEHRLKSLVKEMVEVQLILNQMVGQVQDQPGPSRKIKREVSLERMSSETENMQEDEVRKDGDKSPDELLAEASAKLQKQVDSLHQVQIKTKENIKRLQLRVRAIEKVLTKEVDKRPSSSPPERMKTRSKTGNLPRPPVSTAPIREEVSVPEPAPSRRDSEPIPVGVEVPRFPAAKRKRVDFWLQESSNYNMEPIENEYDFEEDPAYYDVPPDEPPVFGMDATDDLLSSSSEDMEGCSPRHYEIRVDSGMEMFFCVCGDTFESKSLIDNHIRNHVILQREEPSAPTFVCTYCRKTFSRHANLKTHVTQTHARKYTGRKFGCPVCQATFDQMHELRAHKMKVHFKHQQLN